LTGDGVSYLFHVDPKSGDLISDHFGAPTTDFVPPAPISTQGWHDGLVNVRREFPDVGRSDMRLPAVHIKHADGNTVSAFTYRSHELVEGKPPLPGLPATWGNASDVSTLLVTLYDNYSDVTAVLSYSIFPRYDAVVRSFQLHNNGSDDLVLERAASFSTDLPNLDLNMIALQGDWSHEMNRVVRKVQYGESGSSSNTTTHHDSSRLDPVPAVEEEDEQQHAPPSYSPIPFCSRILRGHVRGQSHCSMRAGCGGRFHRGTVDTTGTLDMTVDTPFRGGTGLSMHEFVGHRARSPWQAATPENILVLLHTC
jgi:hypothetical protein